MLKVTKYYVLPTEYICVFCADLYCYNRDAVCLLRGTKWIFKGNTGYSSSWGFIKAKEELHILYRLKTQHCSFCSIPSAHCRRHQHH